MKYSTRLFAVAIGLVLTLATVPKAQADSITREFLVAVIEGPFAGTTAYGTFSYDSSSIVLGGLNQNTGLLTALDFTFGGITYNQNTANTGLLNFDSAGVLIDALFGSDCHAGECRYPPPIFSQHWSVHLRAGPEHGGFSYNTPIGNPFLSYGGVADFVSQVPETPALTLLSIGVLALIMGRLITGPQQASPR